MPIKILITGGTGFLGRRLVRSLLENDVRLRLLVRDLPAAERLVHNLPGARQRRIELISGDLTRPESLPDALEGIDIVYHLAAPLTGSLEAMLAQTVGPTRDLCAAAADAHVKRVVLVSSMGVYGTQFVPRWGTLDETTPVDPHPELRDAYTHTKLLQESAAREIGLQRGLPVVVVRPGVIYGPGRSLLTSRVGLTVGSLFLRMGGRQPLPYTHVDNCAEAVKLAGLVAGTDGEIFNVVDDHLPTGAQILRLLRQQGDRRRTVWIPSGLIGPVSALVEWGSWLRGGGSAPVLTRYKSAAMWKPLNYSNAKARQNLNWSPRISLEAGLQSAIAGEHAIFNDTLKVTLTPSPSQL